MDWPKNGHQLYSTISLVVSISDYPSPVVDVLPFSLLAVVLAPFFVHLEILFGLGYRPAMHKRINNAIGKEITRIRKEEGNRRRKAQ